MIYIKLFEKFQEDIVPVEFQSDVKKIEKLIKSKNFKEVKKLLRKFKVSSKSDYKDSIFFKTEFPSEELEKKSKVKNLSKKWNLPFEFTEEELENLIGIFIEDEKITDIFFKEIIRLNPQLEVFNDINFKEGDYYPKNNVIGGVCSRFNLRDILDFIDNRRSIDYVDDGNYIFKSIDDFYSNIYNSVKKSVKDIGYFPSPYTLRKILGKSK